MISLESSYNVPPNVGQNVLVLGNSGAALTIDLSKATNFTITLNNTCTFTFSNPSLGGQWILYLTQDVTGTRLVTWPTIKWLGAVAPTLSVIATRIDMIEIFYDGTNFYGRGSINLG